MTSKPQITALIAAIESHMTSIRQHTSAAAEYSESRVRVIAALTVAFQAGPHGLGESGMLAIEIVELAMKLPPQPGAGRTATTESYVDGTVVTRVQSFPLPHAMLADCVVILRRVADAPDGAQLDGAWPPEVVERANAARYVPRVDLARVDLPEVVVRRE